MADNQSQLAKDILSFQYNPAGIQRAFHAELERASNGEIQVVDPTNPFVFAIESAAVGIAAVMTKVEVNTRKQYPYSAQTPEDLYPHMSDKDFVDRFASPATAVFNFQVPLEEVTSRMVVDPDTGYKKLVIPRNTFITVGGVVFSLQYPIEIRQLAHGGLTVVYDVEKPSPLQVLETNVIEHEIRAAQNQDWLYFSFETYQFSIVSQRGTLNAAQDFTLDVPLSDQYYYTRVYVQNPAGDWVEIATTHTDQIYDIKKPTAVLTVLENAVRVKVPQIYTSTGQLNKGIRIDAYQTKGPINMLLYEYPLNAVVAKFMNYDKADDTVFTAPLKTMRTFVIWSDQVASGGKDALSFEALRDRVIQNSMGLQQLPITNVNARAALANKNYEIVTNIDNITNRAFLATRAMPDPADTSLLTAAAATIETVRFALRDATLISSILDNGSQITITPKTIYRNVNGVTTLVPDAELAALMAMTPEKRAIAVTASTYLYTPFHYVLDLSGSELDARPYYLDKPTVETKLFVAENDTTLIQVATGVYKIDRVEGGYKLTVCTRSGKEFKALNDIETFAQLAYTPVGEKRRAYVNGQLVGKTEKGERIYTFDLGTNFALDKEDNLNLTKFSMFNAETIPTSARLREVFDILYATTASLGNQWRANSVDETLGKFLLPASAAGLAHEQLKVRFGYSLKTLWARAKSVISTIEYERYAADVQRVYEKDVLMRDANGVAVLIDTDTEPKFVVLHHKGDPVVDENNQPVLLHRKGDVKRNPTTGLPIVLNPRGLIRQIDFMLIEGAYWFATDPTTSTYRETLTATLVDWLINDLGPITSELLEQTRLYFYPKKKMGTVDVMVANGLTASIAAGQAFVVYLYVSASVYSNLELRERLSKTTISTISQGLDNTTVSLDALTTDLRKAYGNDVISVQVAGLGGAAAYPAVTLLHEADRLSIRKRLTAQADGSLIVEEDVTCNFVRHEMQ